MHHITFKSLKYEKATQAKLRTSKKMTKKVKDKACNKRTTATSKGVLANLRVYIIKWHKSTHTIKKNPSATIDKLQFKDRWGAY